jgi:ABC-2 type transport system ATP-binding protein
MNCIELQHVTKAYATKVAAQNVSLAIPEASVFGLLGPNGAGKTTLIRMINRITLPDSGNILFKGKPLQEEHQAFIGYMPEERGLYKKMMVQEQVDYLLQLKGMSAKDARKASDYWLDRLELGAWKKRKTEELSKGMQQKAQFATTVAHNPTLLILDEPFSGLDPINAQLIEEIITELKQKGTTVLFSTHRMEQVEEFCDRIALINNAQIVLEDNVRAARRKYRKNIYIVESDNDLSAVALPPAVTVLEAQPHKVKLQLGTGMSSKDLIAFLNDKVELSRFELYLPGLREIFIEVVESSNQTQTTPAPVAA